MAPWTGSSRRRLSTPILVGCAVLFVAALAVQLTRTGIDLFVLLVAGFILLVLERTLGDWIAESIGATGTALVFAVAAGLSVMYVLDEGGRTQASRFFALAEARGYKPLWFGSSDKDEDSAEAKLANRVSAAADAGIGASSAPGPRPPAVSPGPGSSSAPLLPPTSVDTATPATRDSSGSAPAATSVASSGWFHRPTPTGVPRVSVHPDLVNQGETVAVRFVVAGETAALPNTVVFRVNDRHLVTVPVTSNGTADATFVPQAPGTYRIRVDVPGGGYSYDRLMATVTVLPARR